MKQKSFTKNHSIYVALELGSSKIACMVGKQGNNENMEILGYGTILTKSIRKGLVIDSEKSSIKRSLRGHVMQNRKPLNEQFGEEKVQHILRTGL